MKPVGYLISGALVVLALGVGTPDVWAQSRGHQGGGGGSRATGSSGGGGGSRGSSGGGGAVAVPRGSGGSGGGGSVSRPSGDSGSRPSGGTRTGRPSAIDSGSDAGTAVQRGGSRPNSGGHPVTGTARVREGGYYRPGGSYYRYYPYDPYYLYGYGAFGLGAFYYDPFWWGGYPYGYGYGSPWGYGGYYGGGGYYRDPQDADGVKGGLKLKISPEEAEVFVDGYYVGVVDDYNGPFQRLPLVAGTHRIEIRAAGFTSLTFDVKIEPRETISYHGELQAAPAR